MRRRTPVLLAFAAALLIPQTAQAFPAGLDYVALGDSFTAGPWIPSQVDPFLCMRSSRNYPSKLNAEWASQAKISSFTDVSCSGATTGNMTVAQDSNPPQFNALKPTTDLVTITIGGNDVGFSSIMTECMNRTAKSFLFDPAPCRSYYTAGGDQLEARVKAARPKVAGVVAGIKQRSPNAEIVIVGYLHGVSSSRSCVPVVPFRSADNTYLDSVQQKLNEMIEAVAREKGAKFVNMYNGSFGRDACAPPGTKWVEGAIPTSKAFPFHPNESGMAAVANQIKFCDASRGKKAPGLWTDFVARLCTNW